MFVTYRLEFHDQNFWSEETGEQGGEEVVVLGPRRDLGGRPYFRRIRDGRENKKGVDL